MFSLYSSGSRDQRKANCPIQIDLENGKLKRVPTEGKDGNPDVKSPIMYKNGD